MPDKSINNTARSTGSCLCGKVKFQITGDITDASLCHCSICRKATGSAFGAYGGVESDQFRWVHGSENLKEFSVSEALRKYFCKNCGSTIATTHQSWPEFVYISLGCLDGNTPVKLEYHQFVDSRASWYTLCDNIRQYREWPNEGE